MTQTEYDKAKEECWIAVKKELDLHYWGGPTLDIVSSTFDRAYVLGKQEKEVEYGSLWSRLTDEEKREMQCHYHTNKCVLRDHKKRTGDKAQSKAVARMKLLENLFGKDNLIIENK